MRRFVIIAGISGLALALVAGVAVVGGLAWAWQRSTVDTTGEVEFANPLAIPPLAPSVLDDQGRRVFTLSPQTGEHDLGTGPVPTWGFNGDYLGPTLRAHRGEEVLVNVENQLPVPTTVHWHGMELPASADGGPHQEMAPGQSWSPSWQIDQPAATLWYHPHPHGETETHVYRGLAGMFIVDDDPASALDLPHEYGVDDLPVIVQDKQIEDGELVLGGSFGGAGTLGDTIVVNGTPAPYTEVTTEAVRLRLLNGSTARTYQFGFDDDREFALIGTDGGLLTAPYRTDRVMLSPGERAEVVVRLAPGEQPVLRSYPPDLGLNAFSSRFSGGADRFDVLQLRAADTLEPRPQVPEQLVEIPRLDPAEAVADRIFRLSGREINGQQMDMGRIDATILAGSVETWQVHNAHEASHNFHTHGVQFQVLSVGGEPPPPPLQGWKDTIYLRPQVTYTLIARFDLEPDPTIPFMFHCHLLLHEDEGMMGQFVVVEPGQAPAPLDRSGHDHD